MDKPNITNNYYAPIGQKIDYVETINVRFDKDMNMQIEHAEKVVPSDAAPMPAQPERGCSDLLCVALNSRQREVLRRAEKEGIIRYNAARKGYDKGETSTQALVAYLCGKLFCGDRVRRDEAGESVWVQGRSLEEAQYCQQLFAFDVAGSRRQRKGKTPPAGFERIESLFDS